MAPIEMVGIIAGAVMLLLVLVKFSNRSRSRQMLRMDMENENNHLRQIVAQMSIDRHVSGRRR